MNIDIEKLENIKNELEALSEKDALFIDENGKTKYAIISIDTYDKVEDLLQEINGDMMPQIKVIGNDEDLSYEEYERIKSLIMDAVEKTFKPKADKLN